MVMPIWKMTKKILKDLEIPKQWENMKIKSIYKNKGSRDDMKNRRGIFLMSVVSKLFERIILKKIQENINMDECQNGGKKGRSTQDNWIVLMAVLDNNQRKKEHTFVVMADAEKCFDKLWLKDSIVDIKDSGVRETDSELIRKMSKQASSICPYVNLLRPAVNFCSPV